MLTQNDFLSSVTIDIWEMVEDAVRNECRSKKYMVIKEKKTDVLMLETLPNQSIKDEKLKQPSKLKVSLEIVPKKE